MELVALLAVGALTLGVIGFAGRLPEPQQVKRDLAHGHLDTVATLADGKTVTLRGTVRAIDDGLTAPLTGRRCVYWRLMKGRERSERGVPFELETADGRVRVVASMPRLGVHGEVRDGAIEHVVPIGAEVTLRGVCTYEPDPTGDHLDGIYRGGKRPTRPVIGGSRRVRMLIG